MITRTLPTIFNWSQILVAKWSQTVSATGAQVEHVSSTASVKLNNKHVNDSSKEHTGGPDKGHSKRRWF